MGSDFQRCSRLWFVRLPEAHLSRLGRERMAAVMAPILRRVMDGPPWYDALTGEQWAELRAERASR